MRNLRTICTVVAVLCVTMACSQGPIPLDEPSEPEAVAKCPWPAPPAEPEPPAAPAPTEEPSMPEPPAAQAPTEELSMPEPPAAQAPTEELSMPEMPSAPAAPAHVPDCWSMQLRWSPIGAVCGCEDMDDGTIRALRVVAYGQCEE